MRQTFTNGTDELRLDIGYDLAGREVSRTRSADLAGSILVGTTTSDFQGGLLSSLTHTGPTGATLAAYGYEYDAAGRVTQQTEGAVTTNYTYDATGQLIQAGAASYSFTANGNPTHGGAIPEEGNTLQSDGTWSYTYDAAGNVSTRHDATAGLTWTYSYDTINQLTHAVLTDTSSAVLVEAEYGYDAFGNRIRIEVTQGNTTTTTNAVFLAVGSPRLVADLTHWRLYADLNALDVVQTQYISGEEANSWQASVTTTAVRWLYADRLGSIRMVADDAGAVIDTIQYDAHGAITAESAPSVGGRLKYAGYEEDAWSGLYRAGARYYQGTPGRFLTRDPLGLAPDSNPYRYVGNDPVNATDPSGLAAAPPFIQQSSLPTHQQQLIAATTEVDRLASILKKLQARSQMKASYKEPPGLRAGSATVIRPGQYRDPSEANTTEQLLRITIELSQAINRRNHLRNLEFEIPARKALADAQPNGFLDPSKIVAKTHVSSSLVPGIGPTSWNVLKSTQGLIVIDVVRADGETSRAAIQTTNVDNPAWVDYWRMAEADADRVVGPELIKPLTPLGRDWWDVRNVWERPIAGLDVVRSAFTPGELEAAAVRSRERQHHIKKFWNEPPSRTMYIAKKTSAFGTGMSAENIVKYYQVEWTPNGYKMVDEASAYVPIVKTARMIVILNEKYKRGKNPTIMELVDVGFSFVDDVTTVGPGIVAGLNKAEAVVASYLKKPSPKGTAGLLEAIRDAGISVEDVRNELKKALQTGTAEQRANALRELAKLPKECFAAGTPMLVPGGSCPVECLRPGDLVLSRDEADPCGPIEAKRVEEVFVRTGRIMTVHVKGRTIRTTSEHPFWVEGAGWLEAGALVTGNVLRSHLGDRIVVEGVEDTGEYETVYNLRVADYHTYFVGCQEWGFSVWVHNKNPATTSRMTADEFRALVRRAATEPPFKGGQRIDPAELQRRLDVLRKMGVDAETELELLDTTTRGYHRIEKETLARGGEIYKAKMRVRPNATEFEFLHEELHTVQAEAMGRSKYFGLSEVEREQAVFDAMVKHEKWASFAAEEKQFAVDYLHYVHGGNVTGFTPSPKNPFKP